MKTKYAVLFLVAAAIYCLGLISTTDPDLWWHLKTGERILSDGVPVVDSFSFSVTGKLWTAHEWLSEVVLFSIFNAGGLPALMIFFAVLGVVTFSFVYAGCPGRPYLAAILTLLSFIASRFLWGARPQIFNILMLAVFMWLIQTVRAGKRDWKWLCALPPLTLLWVNLHSGYLAGIVAMAVFLAGDAFQVFALRSDEGTLPRKALVPFLVITLLSLGAALVNPAGYRIFLYPFETLMSRAMNASLLEWQRPDFHYVQYWPFLAIMILGVLAFMISTPRRNFSNFLLYSGTMTLGLLARRHIPFFAVVAIPIIAGALAEGMTSSGWRGRFESWISPDRFRAVRFVVNPLLVVLFAAGVFFWTDLRLKKNNEAISKRYPLAAVRFIKEKGLAGRQFFNEYNWGGYLIWNNIPVFIDGRADLYGDSFFLEYGAIFRRFKTVQEIAGIFSRYKVDGLLLRPRSAVAGLYRMNKEWKEIYRDRMASVFVKVLPVA
ncbi:MAG TPA: hypothetical protein PLL75_05990 [Candidatus Omnitrophota bacterium]|nr:hypothetical protein [Candidatus Omnitrophota bacterium]HPS37259.1 hypothetical protein [Candidatus Omnitrophota bacterium]